MQPFWELFQTHTSAPELARKSGEPLPQTEGVLCDVPAPKSSGLSKSVARQGKAGSFVIGKVENNFTSRLAEGLRRQGMKNE
ncbi:MAG: hypothetical protein ACREDM_05040 [Methylocella sp.]